MREKSENEARDRYARRYAALLAVDSMIQFRGKGIETVLTVEAEDRPLWDDVLLVEKATNTQHRHQIKRQLTPLSSDDFKKYIIAAVEGDSQAHYHFVFPSFIEVSSVGETRILHGLCDRIQQIGANAGKVINNLRVAERAWLDCLTEWSGLDDPAVFELLKRIHINITGLEEDINTRALRLLEPIFSHTTETAWNTITSIIGDIDGVVEITPNILWEKMPSPAVDEIETLYWSFIDEIERRFHIDNWMGISDHLLRNLIPLEFLDDILTFLNSVQTTAWPQRHPTLEKAIHDLARLTHEYVHYFYKRSEYRQKCLCENVDYKRIFPNPHYHDEVKAAKVWDQGVQVRLHNMVVGINELFTEVRHCLKQTYRLRDGRLGIHDSIGMRSEREGMTFYPKEYIEVAESEGN